MMIFAFVEIHFDLKHLACVCVCVRQFSRVKNEMRTVFKHMIALIFSLSMRYDILIRLALYKMMGIVEMLKHTQFPNSLFFNSNEEVGISSCTRTVIKFERFQLVINWKRDWWTLSKPMDSMWNVIKNPDFGNNQQVDIIPNRKSIKLNERECLFLLIKCCDVCTTSGCDL